jgi:hypothetical protein
MLRLRLTDEHAAPQLQEFLRARGFLVVLGGSSEFRVHLRDHVSDRFDRIAARSAVERWSSVHPSVAVEEIR